MPMWDQLAGEISAAGFRGRGSFTHTEQLHNEHILAEIALTGITVLNEDFHQTWAFITQIVSDNGVENFGFTLGDTLKTTLSRTGVTSITFKIQVQYSGAAARWVINRWE